MPSGRFMQIQGRSPWARALRKVFSRMADKGALIDVSNIPGWEKMADGRMRPRVVSGSSSSEVYPWDIELVTENEIQKIRLIPGSLIDGLAYNALNQVTIANVASSFDMPSAGQCLYIEMDYNSGAQTAGSLSLEMGNRWAEWPRPFRLTTGEGDIKLLDRVYVLLWSFHATADIPIGTVGRRAISDDVVGFKHVPSSGLALVSHRWKDPDSGFSVSVAFPVPSFGALPIS